MPSDADLQAMSQIVNKALQDATASLTKFANTAKESVGASGGFKQMDSALLGIARNLAGPVGVAAGFYAAGKAVADFADQRLKLSLFSKDVGFSADTIHGLRRAMFMAGKETADADRAISAIGSSLKDLQARRYGAAVYADLMQIGPGVAEVAKELLAAVDKGDFDKALRLIEERWQGLNGAEKWGVRTRRLVAQALHSTESDIEAGFDRLNHHIDAATQAAAEAQAKQIRQYRQMFADAWEYALGGAIDAIERNRKALEGARWLTPTEIKNMMFGGAAPDTTKPKEGEAGESWWKRMMTPKVIEQNPATNSFGLPINEEANQYMGFKIPGKQSSLGTSGSTDFSGRRRSDDLIDVQTDSNKALRDIRDTLQRMETGVVVPTGGTAGAGTSYGVGARGGALQAPLGGFRGGGGGSRGDRNNNPGNLKFGAHAKAFGATHADAGGFAVFPDAASGAAAHDTLLKSDAYKGLTLDQFGDKYAEGSASWKKTVGGALGLKGGDIVDNQSPGLPGAIRKAEGTVEPGGVPSNILAEARRVVAAGGGAEGAKSYIQSKGYNVDSAWCGDFAAAVVKGAGGTPPKNYQVASNWRNFGQPVEGDPQPGDVAVRRGAATGSTGSHVTIVDQFDPETGRFKGIGGNQGRGGMRSNFDRNRFDFRRGDEARETIDKTQSDSQRVDANMSASIDFKNMPSWVKTAVDDNGKFKNLKVSRSTPQNGRTGSGLGDHNPWAYE